MASSISICSNALLALGAHPINDFDEDTDHARLCANLYPLSVHNYPRPPVELRGKTRCALLSALRLLWVWLSVFSTGRPDPRSVRWPNRMMILITGLRSADCWQMSM
jgi:hypothetical protein